MPNVLILGATGYLGFSLAQSLLRSGNYTVYGLARTPAKAKLLIQHEITPVLGDAADPSTFTSLIATAPIDIVIDVTSAYEHASTILNSLIAASKSRLDTLKAETAAGPKLAFIYTSGTWVHGSPASPVSDLHPVGSSLSRSSPATAVAWRGKHEQAILAARDVLDVAIVRPGELYGRGSWLWGTYWSLVLAAAKSKTTDPILLPVSTDARPPVVHVDDAASGIHVVADRIHGLLGGWPVFDLVAETMSVTEMMPTVRKTLNAAGELVYQGAGGNPFHEAMDLASNCDSARARAVLGWVPKRTGFLTQLPLYVKAWEAGLEK